MRDLGAESGTFVNEQPVTQHRAEPGDRIRIGRTRIIVEGGEPAIAQPLAEPARHLGKRGFAACRRGRSLWLGSLADTSPRVAATAPN